MKTSTKFIDKFRESVDLYELCKNDSKTRWNLNDLLNQICLDKNSLYQTDWAKLHKTYFLYTSSTPLSFRVLRYVYAEDELYFKEYYKSKKERELATSLELITEAIKI